MTTVEQAARPGWAPLLAALVLVAGPRFLWAQPCPIPVPPPLIEHVYPTPEPPRPHVPVQAPPVPASPAPEDPPPPVVTIRVRVPAAASAAEELEYHLCVENCSAVPAHHVLVRNPLPANAHFIRAQPEPATRMPELHWLLGTLPPGARRDICLVLKPLGPGDLKNCARVQFEHGQCVCTRILAPAQVARPYLAPRPEVAPRPDLAPRPEVAPRPEMPPRPLPARSAIRLHKTGPARAILYDSLAYQLLVTNTGTTEVTGLKVTDTLPDGLEHSSGKSVLTWDVRALAAGQSYTIAYQAVAKKTGRLCNRAQAAAAGGLTARASSCVTVGEPQLALTKTGPRQRYLNLPATYLITVSNPGTVPAENVVITDPVPAQTTFVRASKGGQLAGAAVQWTIGTLEPGQSRTVQVTLQARAAGAVRNQATASADRGLSAQAEVTTEFKGVSALLVEVVDTDDPVEVGAETSYVITVKNQGMVPATNIRIKALIPAELMLTRARGPADNHLGEHTREGQNLLYDPLKTLAPGATVTYDVFVTARTPGDVRFKVEVTADQLKAGGPVHEEESTTIYSDIAALANQRMTSHRR